MITYILLVALANLTIGIILGYFYGPQLVPGVVASLKPGPADETAPHALLMSNANEPATSRAVDLVPAAAAEVTTGADDLRPVKPTTSREISAVDLADVLGELGLEPSPSAPPVAKSESADARKAVEAVVA